jgi:hypothetical protein
MKIQILVLFCVVLACSGINIRDNSDLNEISNETSRFLVRLKISISFLTNFSSHKDPFFLKKPSLQDLWDYFEDSEEDIVIENGTSE